MYKNPKMMVIRDFSAEHRPAVEPFGSGGAMGCIVRWDYQPVMTIIPETYSRAASRRRRNLTTAEEPQPAREIDSGLVSYSEMRYIGIPDPERVIADIRRDLEIRYGTSPRPEIDFDAYRTAIASLNKA